MKPTILLPALLVILGVSTGVARADYTISWCHNGGSPPPFVNGGSQNYGIADYCENNPPAVYLNGYSYPLESGQSGGRLNVGWYRATITAPSGITIKGVKATLVSEAQKSGSSVYVEAGDDGGPIFKQEISRERTTTSEINQTLPGRNTTVWLGEFCSPNQNVACYFASPWGVLSVQEFSLRVHDDEQPSLALSGGRLLLPGTQSGTEDMTFSASAHASGIAQVNAYLGSTLVGSNAYQSTQCSYTQFDPCPRSVSDNLKVNTRWVPDGTYPLILEATDASGNTASVESGNQITVANGASPAGASQGTSASLRAPGPPNGHNATTKAQLTYLSGRNGKITTKEGQATTISGRLTDQTGTSIPDATLEVLSQTVGSSTPFAVLGHTSTNASGVYTFRVPPGPSRVIRTGYRAFANDSGYDATADLTENVTATTSLHVTPKRIRGRTFTFLGEIHAANFPSGQEVEIQALVGRAWTHVIFARVTPNGRFKVHYRLKHLYHHVTFIFRALPVASPIWPYQPLESNEAQLHLL